MIDECIWFWFFFSDDDDFNKEKWMLAKYA